MALCEGIMWPEKNLLIFLFGILAWFYPLSCWCLNLTALDLRGMQASQISDYRNYAFAARAIDGNPNTQFSVGSCSATGFQHQYVIQNSLKFVHVVGLNSHPWWKVYLGANHCLGRITLVNRGDCCNNRLIGAVVRAGIESDIFNNAACGLPVTSDQASIPGGHIPFLCDPPVIAQYVSVDDKDHKMNEHENNLITLCEVMVEEYPLEYCPQSTTATIADPSVSITCMSTLMFVDKEVSDARPLSVLHMKSPMQCFMRCKITNECWSFDYDMTFGQCRLYDVKAGYLKADDQPGCLVYAVVRG
ncbi:pentraxin fusion protein-like [Asterias amurensis]|uniref:pentraxin fusion protein-like n=1 Tax=Asterias amurensis TaxID=7602 RepID=UPI003AB2DC89